MNRFFCFIAALTFFGCAHNEKKIALNATEVIKKNGVEVPVYDFEAFENLLHQNDNKARIINFWATWCKPCIAELPYFELINNQYRDKEVEVILVSLDIPSDIETKLIPFLKKQKIDSKVLVLDDPDANSWIPKVNSTWSGAIPATIIYKGNTAHFYEQSFTYNELEKQLKRVL
ncbi:TlpA family protein disulfide reductase [Aquimarina sp. ERC-38]|uniref:TlpA family protein disulfide reductase n=1 Tax=Aquimarina sp. ERC-38 TaxID=2949996 RepID=UPI002247F0AA|nr:TlpA disulfide reductase family protein [Aquimarina sp. ERC-38]UZO79282.1 TlpA family protein disulfide reductase [Aquimarina sp. ERC-38]